MKISLNRKIGYVEVDSNYFITLHALAEFLQEATIKHYQKVGESPPKVNKKSVWILYQIGIEILKWVSYEQEIKIITWHRGRDGYRAYREFEVYSGKKKIATASAAYLYYDIKNQKIKKVPENVDTIYALENETAFNDDLALWKPLPIRDKKFEIDITTRLSDFDPMEHVNNTVYIDYIETIFFSYLNTEKKIRKIKIQYIKEIDKSVKKLKGAIAETDTGYLFKLFDSKRIFSFGEIEI